MRRFWQNSVEVRRLVADAGDTETSTTHISLLYCNIQPLEDSFGIDLEGSYGKDFLMFCDSADIKEGDQIIDGSDTYEVRGVDNPQVAQFDFLKLRIRKI